MRGEIEYGNILKSVYQRIAEGGQYRTSDLLPLVQKDCELTDEQMAERTKGDNSPKVQKNVQWALTHLYGSGLINRVSRGLYEIAPHRDHLLSMDDVDFEKLVRSIYNSRNGKSEYTEIAQQTIAKIQKLVPSLAEESNDWKLQLCFMSSAPDKSTIIKGIRSLLVDAEDDINLDELQELLNEAKEQRSIKYELVLNVNNRGNKREPRLDVDMYVLDDKGNKYPFKLETAGKAMFLTFVYLDSSVTLMDFCDTTHVFNKTFYKIYNSLYKKKGTTKKYSFDPVDDGFDKIESAEKATTHEFSKMRGVIVDALPNDWVARQFVLINNDGKYSTKASNMTVKGTIKKHFGLK